MKWNTPYVVHHQMEHNQRSTFESSGENKKDTETTFLRYDEDDNWGCWCRRLGIFTNAECMMVELSFLMFHDATATRKMST